MAPSSPKVVKVDDAVIAFPGDMEDEHVARLIKSFREKNKGKRPLLTTEESEHARQLSPAQPLSTAIPKLPAWATTPLLNDKDLEETPQGKAITAKSQEEFTKNHPQISAALAKGNNPYVLGALKGTNEFIKSMSSPVNAALMLGAPESKLLSGFFAVQAMRGSFRDAQSAKKAFEGGKNEEATQYLTQALLGAGIGTLAGAHAAKDIPIPEPVKRFVANEEGTVGPQEGGSERRANPELRKRIDEMTPEEMRKLLKTSDVVDLPNKRSFLEDQHFSPMPFVARSDADGLKAFNDKFGYEKGDELLKAKAEALKEAGLNAYHEKGDEFLYRGKNQKELQGRLEKAREILRNKVFDVTLEDGRHVQLKGVDFSYGTGKDLKEAESKQHAHKQSREDAGLRKRGDISGLVEVQGQNPQNPSPSQSSAAASLAEIKKQAAELKPTTAYQAIDQSQPFYLKSENLINEKMKGPMPAEDVHKMLLSNGVKPEEMQWTGLDEFLKSKGKSKVTPQEMQQLLAGNNLQIKEVQKGDLQHGKELKEPWEIWKASDSGKPVYGVKRDNGLLATEATTGYDSHSLAKFLDQHRDTYSIHEGPVPQAEPPKFGSYTLPGGTNYRELLLTMPEVPKEKVQRITFGDLEKKDPKLAKEFDESVHDYAQRNLTPEERDNELNNILYSGSRYVDTDIQNKIQDHYQHIADAHSRNQRNAGNTFRTSHWPDEVNPASHVRFDDRTGPNGEKILFIEEAQDDWAQKGRKEGYKSNRVPTKATRHDGYWEVHDQDGNFITNIQDWQHPEITNEEQVLKEAQNRLENNPERIRNDGKVPDRPFKKTDEWTALVMKRMVKYAVDHGYDAVAWAQGSVHFDRWGSQRFDWKKNGDHWEVAGTEQHGGNAGGVNIEEEAERQGYLQKGAAKVKTEADLRKIVKQVMSRESNDAQIDTQTKKIWTRMQNEDSGTSMPRKEGFEAYYDQMVPQAANKLGKQWGAKVGETKIVTETKPKKTYVGPSYTYEQLKEIANQSKGTMIEGSAKWVADSVKQGSSLEEAMDAYGSPMLAEKLGGLMDVISKKETKSVPYLPLKSKTGAGVKSVPYSLFGVAGAAVGLQAVKQKADELQKKI